MFKHAYGRGWCFIQTYNAAEGDGVYLSSTGAGSHVIQAYNGGRRGVYPTSYEAGKGVVYPSMQWAAKGVYLSMQ